MWDEAVSYKFILRSPPNTWCTISQPHNSLLLARLIDSRQYSCTMYMTYTARSRSLRVPTRSDRIWRSLCWNDRFIITDTLWSSESLEGVRNHDQRSRIRSCQNIYRIKTTTRGLDLLIFTSSLGWNSYSSSTTRTRTTTIPRRSVLIHDLINSPSCPSCLLWTNGDPFSTSTLRDSTASLPGRTTFWIHRSRQ